MDKSFSDFLGKIQVFFRPSRISTRYLTLTRPASDISEAPSPSPTIAPTSRSSRGGLTTSWSGVLTACTKRTIQVKYMRRVEIEQPFSCASLFFQPWTETLPWRATAAAPGASITRTRCGRSGRVTKSVSGNTGALGRSMMYGHHILMGLPLRSFLAGSNPEMLATKLPE